MGEDCAGLTTVTGRVGAEGLGEDAEGIGEGGKSTGDGLAGAEERRGDEIAEGREKSSTASTYCSEGRSGQLSLKTYPNKHFELTCSAALRAKSRWL